MHLHRLLLTFAAGVLLAQGPPPDDFEPGPPGPPGPPRHEELQQALGLTEDQIRQLTDLRKQEREELRSVLDQLRSKGKTLHELMQSQSPDPAAAGNLLIDMKKLRDQMRGTNAQYREKAVGLLNADQKAKLKSLEEAAGLAQAVRQGVGLNLLAPPEAPWGPGLFRDRPWGPMGARGVFGRGGMRQWRGRAL